MERQDRHRAERRRLPAARQRRARDEGRSANALQWLKGLKDQRADLRRRRRRGRRRESRRRRDGRRSTTTTGRACTLNSATAQTRSAIYHFGNGDVGALVNVSGAAVLKSAHNQDAAPEVSRVSGQRARAGADGEEPRRCSSIRCTRASHPIRCSSRSTELSPPRADDPATRRRQPGRQADAPGRPAVMSEAVTAGPPAVPPRPGARPLARAARPVRGSGALRFAGAAADRLYVLARRELRLRTMRSI